MPTNQERAAAANVQTALDDDPPDRTPEEIAAAEERVRRMRQNSMAYQECGAGAYDDNNPKYKYRRSTWEDKVSHRGSGL